MTAPATQSEGRRRARHGDRRRVCRCCMHRLRGVGVIASVVIPIRVDVDSSALRSPSWRAKARSR